MVAIAREQWITGPDGRTRFHGQPRRGRQTDASLSVHDSRMLREAVQRAEDALLAHLETHAKTSELVEAMSQLDLALRFAGEIEGRPKSRRAAKHGPKLPGERRSRPPG